MFLPSSQASRQTKMFALIEEYQQSVQSQTQFCRENNIPKSTFYYWLRKYKKEQSVTDAFIPLNISHSNAGQNHRIDLPNGVIIYVNGMAGLELISNLISKAVTGDASGK